MSTTNGMFMRVCSCINGRYYESPVMQMMVTHLPNGRFWKSFSSMIADDGLSAWWQILEVY